MSQKRVWIIEIVKSKVSIEVSTILIGFQFNSTICDFWIFYKISGDILSCPSISWKLFYPFMILDQPNTCSLSYWVKRCYLISGIKCAHIPAYVFGQIKPYAALVCSYPFSTPKRSIFIQQTSALRKKKKIAYTFGHFSVYSKSRHWFLINLAFLGTVKKGKS